MAASSPVAGTGSTYGMAFDIGTTFLACSLIDLETGDRIVQNGVLNPQREMGIDVVSRLETACASPANLEQLRGLVNDELQRLGTDLLCQAGSLAVPPIVGFAGNPAMEHLLLGLPVDSLARIPYRPLFTSGRWFSTLDLGWDLAADAYLFPLPGAFVGGDLVAFLHSAGVAPEATGEVTAMYMDLGTNGELAVVANGHVYATSAAAGPAFEGGNLSCGMATVPGAISGVTVAGDRIAVTTVDGAPPVGICGSAVIEALAGLVTSGVVDPTGRILHPQEIDSNLAVRVREVAGQLAFVLHQDAERLVYLSQEDIRQVQLAKAAIRAGMEVLAERVGISLEHIGEIVVTGSFGIRLAPEHLETLGIFAPGMAQRATFTGEGALGGIERMLCEPEGGSAVERLAASFRVVPLSGNPAFERHFFPNMSFAGEKG